MNQAATRATPRKSTMPGSVAAQSMKNWREYLWTATQADAHRDIAYALRLALNFKYTNPNSVARLIRFHEVGTRIYRKRFGFDWVPF